MGWWVGEDEEMIGLGVDIRISNWNLNFNMIHEISFIIIYLLIYDF